MKHKVAVKHPGKPMEIIEIESKYRTDVKPFIAQDDNTILQFVIMKRTENRIFCFACDEEGLIKNLPLNFEMLTQSGNTSFLSRVVGTVVFLVYELEDVYNKEIYDFEIRDITDEDIALAEYVLSDKTQQKARNLAKMDPHIHDKPEFVFRPIDDLNEFLEGPSTSLFRIPSYFIPLEIFGRFKVGKAIEFFADPAGKHKFVAGVRFENRCVVIYCKDTITAKDFSINHELLRSNMTNKDAEKYLQQFLQSMFKMGLPAFLYVSEETYKKYF